MITSETSKMTYTVAEGVTEYAIGFVYNTNPDGSPQIKVYKNKQMLSPLVYGVDYTLSGDGLKIVLSSIEVGDRLDIIRSIPMVQLSDYVIGRIDPEQIETDMDNAVMRDQQLKADMQFIGEVPQDHEERIEELEDDVVEINDKIPTQASTSNQLADKDFVNSSIATSTATFRGTYDTLAELEEVTADESDYGFVVSTDAAGNTVYSRYKYASGEWVFEYNLNNSSFTAAQWAAINSGVTSGLLDSLEATTGKTIGEIFWTMRNDNGLRGAVECNGDSYVTTNFTGAQSIGVLLEAGKVPYVSLAQYATLLAANGSVGVFGWDGTGTTAFRVPSLNDIFIETGTVAELGDYEAAGLPNITGTADVLGTSDKAHKGGNYSGALKSVGTASVYNNYDSTSVTALHGVAIDASLSSSVYGNSNTVQPSAIRYRAMVQLAVAATDEALETCTSVLADVAANTAAIAGADYVVEFQAPTVDNNYTWYRKYKSGWVEQGGLNHSINLSASGSSNMINLPVTMADTNYTAQATLCNQYGGRQAGIVTTTSTTTQVNVGGYASSSGTSAVNWEVKGMAATN